MALKTVSKLSLGEFPRKRRLEACEMAKKNLAQSTKQRSASLLGKEVKKNNLPAERGRDDYVFFT